MKSSPRKRCWQIPGRDYSAFYSQRSIRAIITPNFTYICRVNPAMTWTKELKLNGLVVASDEAASNEIQKMTLKMAVPEGIKCIIKSVEDVTTILDDPRSESMRLMVLVPTVKDAVTLCKRYKNIEMVNIGNAGKMTSGEKKILSKEVMLTADELEALKELTELYPDTFFQGTPAMEKKMASAILKGC